MPKDGPGAFKGGLSSQEKAEECSGPTETRGHHSSVQHTVLGQILWEDSLEGMGQVTRIPRLGGRVVLW